MRLPRHHEDPFDRMLVAQGHPQPLIFTASSTLSESAFSMLAWVPLPRRHSKPVAVQEIPSGFIPAAALSKAVVLLRIMDAQEDVDQLRDPAYLSRAQMYYDAANNYAASGTPAYWYRAAAYYRAAYNYANIVATS